MEITNKPIAITDVETTGLDPIEHEIIEIGLVLINQKTFEIIDRLDIKVLPNHPETADSFAIKLNGYNTSEWENAKTIQEVMTLYGEKTKDAIFCAHNVTFDWGFISKAFKETGVKDQMDYHRLNLFTMTWSILRNLGIKKLNMNEVAKFLEIPEEPTPHRTINGTMTEYEIYKRLLA